jgi:DNA-binding XRE family transcriptional regulator
LKQDFETIPSKSYTDIANIRRRRGLSQTQLSTYANVSWSTIQRLEKEERTGDMGAPLKCTITTMLKIADALEVDLGTLWPDIEQLSGANLPEDPTK